MYSGGSPGTWEIFLFSADAKPDRFTRYTKTFSREGWTHRPLIEKQYVRAGTEMTSKTEYFGMNRKKSEHFVLSEKLEKSPRGDPVEKRECRVIEHLEGKMIRTSGLTSISTRLQMIAEQARKILDKRVRDGVTQSTIAQQTYGLRSRMP
jgi:hypothetical protein